MHSKLIYTRNELGQFSDFERDVVQQFSKQNVDVKLAQLLGNFDDEISRTNYKIPKAISMEDAFNLF